MRCAPIATLALLLSPQPGCDCRADACGDGKVDPPEECDGADLGGSCAGAVCYEDCTLDVSGCATCGTGIAEGSEACDGTDLRGATCASKGFDEGVLACVGCTLDAAACSRCGDGAVGAGEECDGALPTGASCASLGYDSGVLACAVDCSFDPMGCIPINPAALSFDGIDDVLLCPALDLGLPVAAHTWEAWVWLDVTGTSPGTIFEKWTTEGCAAVPSTDRTIDVFWDQGAVSRTAALCSGCGCSWFGFAFPFPGGWHHLSFAIGPDGAGELAESVVVDGGAFVATRAIALPDTSWLDDSTVAIRMGNSACELGTCTPFKGKLDEVRFWSFARTPAEVAVDYAAQLTGGEAGLVAYWPFEEGMGQSTAEVVSGVDCDLGGSPSAESTDPAWHTDTPF